MNDSLTLLLSSHLGFSRAAGDDVNDSLILELSSHDGFSRTAGDDANDSRYPVMLVSAEQLCVM